MALTLTNDYPPGTANGNVCYLCGAAPRTFQNKTERVLDCNVEISYEGWLAICESCWTEGAHLLGMATPAEVTELRERLAAAEDALLSAEGRADEAEEVVVQLRRYDEHRKSTDDPQMAEAMTLTPAPKPAARKPRAKATA